MPKQVLSAATQSILSRSGSGDSLSLDSNASQTKQHESPPTPDGLSRMWTKLKKSGCPFVENLEMWSLSEILKPCDLRIKILHWILISLGVEEKALLQPVRNRIYSTNDIDYRYQNILKVFNAVVPIKKLDLDVIMGKVDGSQQVVFFCFLLDLVIEKGSDIYSQDYSCSTPLSANQLEGTDFHRQCSLIDELLESGAKSELTKLSFKLPDDKCLPEELNPDKNIKRKSTECLNRSWSSTHYEKIQDDLKEMEDKLQKQEIIFKELQEEISYTYEKDDVFVAVEKLSLEMQELKKVTVSFNEAFQKDLKIWCGCTFSEPSPLDPLVTSLYENTGKLMQFCQSLNIIKTSFNKINTDLKAKLTALLGKKGDDVPASFREQLTEWMEILQEAIALENNEE